MIEIEKNYRTKDGSKVVVYTVEAGGEYPVHAGVIKPGGNEMKMQVYDLNGNTPNNEEDLKIVFDEEQEDIPKTGSVVLVANCEDILPTVGVFKRVDDDGIWALVDIGEDGLELMPFDMMYSDVDDMDEVLSAFIDDRNECLKKEQEEEEQSGSEIFEELVSNLFGGKMSISIRRK